MATAGTASSVVVLGVLCAALASHVADVEAAKKPTPALARSLGAPPAATAAAAAKITPSAAKSPASAAAAKTTAAVARPASTAASKRGTRPAAHRSTRKPGGAGGGGDDGSAGSTATATPTTAAAGTSREASGQEMEVNLTDVAVLKSAMPIKPFIKAGTYPFIATVQKICGGGCHTRQFCAGAILAPQWVISMPQCAETHPGEGLVVRAGDSFIWPGDHTPTQKVIEVVWHEAATSTDDYPKYDVILMRLENSFQFGENINAIALAPPTHPAEGAVSVVGWTSPGHAEQVEVNVTHGTVRGTEDCQKIAPQEALAADTLCVQPVEPLPERCSYDLGDPVFVEAEQQPLLVGLLSRWYLPCVPERPVVALKISSVYAWVYEKVNPPPVTGRPTHATAAEATTPTTAVTAAMITGTTSTTPTLPTPATVAVPTPAPPTTAPPATPTHHPSTASSAPPSWPTLPTASSLPPPTITTATPAPAPSPTTPTAAPASVTASSPTGSSTSTPPRPPAHVKPMTVSSSSASGGLSNTSSTSDAALLAGHMESSLSYSLGTANVDPAKPALANSVSVGWANCRDVGGALGMSYALAYSFIGEGAATAASTVNATCLEMNAVQSQGWSISTSGGSAPVSVRAFVMEHLASIPGLPRQPTLKYL